MDIYLDTCALNRLVDDHSQRRVRQEAEAVDHILELAASGQFRWAQSPILGSELNRMPDRFKLAQLLPLLSLAQVTLPVTPVAENRAQVLQRHHRLGYLDALHLAVCELALVPVLLTVDVRFIRRASLVPSLSICVENPVDWLQRTTGWQPSP